ncbi:inositol 1,4,5-trisphosphate receptor-interacting protein-like 1 [Strigops habroptila]|nr:inositol 1,4,5-trisphosphate receptor-interacting protein-like 1 [Strigops habroptila]
MALTSLLVWVLQGLIVNVWVFADELGKSTRDRMQYWQFWVMAGVLLFLIFGLCWWFRKKSCEVDSSSKVEEEDSDGEGADWKRDFGTYFTKRTKWSLHELRCQSELALVLVDNLLHVCRRKMSKSFLPVLEPAIGVGSAFEGWSPQEDDTVYCLLVPLRPPHAHTFRLEIGTVAQMLGNKSRIRVEGECTCMREQTVGAMWCFLHHTEKKLRMNRKPRLIHHFCTGSYLDVKKTASWFQGFVGSFWKLVPQSCHYNMKVLPSCHSCKLQFTHDSGRILIAEIMFGVQLGLSDIFLSSLATQAFDTPSTWWTPSYAVAEAKFFRLMARQAPHDSFHLNCLQLCTRLLVGTRFSTYTLKTVVMHLLTTTPLAGWRKRDFHLRLDDIMGYLCCCLEKKCLNHFFFGNKKLPKEIILPPALQRAEPLNLLQHLEQDPAAHAQAMEEFKELRYRLTTQLFYGH